MDIEALYREYKPLLFRVAYRLLGSASDAEDAVQDAFVALQQSPQQTIEHPKAYLARAVTNHALNKMKSAQRKRETYVGPWLPEPVLSEPYPADADPALTFERQEQYGYAWMVMLEKLSAPERAVFVLRETLQYDYAELAEMLDRSEAACRKLYSRAKSKLEELPEPAATRAGEGEAFVRAFTEAARNGSFEPLIGLLTDDATLISDGGGKARAALRPIRGKERVLAFFRGIRSKGSLDGELRALRINGQLGLLWLRQGKTPLLLTYGPAPGTGINALFLVSNPDKLKGAELFLP